MNLSGFSESGTSACWASWRRCSSPSPPRTCSSAVVAAHVARATSIATRRLDVPRFFYPLAAYAALTLDVRGILGRSERQLRRFEAADTVSRRADGVRAGARHESAVRRAGDHHRRRDQRALRHLPVRRAAVRQSRPAPAGRARPLHDVLGRADAGDVRGGGAHSVHEAIASGHR